MGVAYCFESHKLHAHISEIRVRVSEFLFLKSLLDPDSRTNHNEQNHHLRIQKLSPFFSTQRTAYFRLNSHILPSNSYDILSSGELTG